MLENAASSTLMQAAQALRSGGLVAFPTETVYGLGADASQPDAVERVFRIKGRPFQDPLIVHCASMQQTFNYISESATDWQRSVHQALGQRFWPGPLTLVLPAHESRIAEAVTGRTGWVGLRCPNHPIALAFLEFCDRPVAAPSANLFGHVSPTTAKHVFDDFPHVDNLWIVDGGACGFGIESTVVRINATSTLEVLRPGGVGRAEIVQCLVEAGLFKDSEAGFRQVLLKERFVKESVAMPALDAPGQLLVHYAPRIDCQMVSWVDGTEQTSPSELVSSEHLKKTVLIDFEGRFSLISARAGAYCDLSRAGSSLEAAQNLFAKLRWAENFATTDLEQWRIWIADPKQFDDMQTNEIFLALSDRIFRSASGRRIKICITPDSGQVFASIHSQ